MSKRIECEAAIIGFEEDRGKNKDGRLTISIEQFPKEDNEIITFLEWMGNEFIGKGGLYAVDIVAGAKGKYRVYKNKLEKNGWIELK